MRYTAKITREGRRWLAEFLDAPGCQTFANSQEELRSAASEALAGWLEAHIVDGDAPPRPKKLRPRAGLWQVEVDTALSIAVQLRWARQDAGLTQAQLAKRAQVSQQQVAKLERPGGNPTIETLVKVTRSLGIRLEVQISGGNRISSKRRAA